MALESFELSRLNQAANLRKRVCQTLEDWIDAEADARFARRLLESRHARTPEANNAVLPILTSTPDRQFDFRFPRRLAN
jgi:hypothetical protein